MLLFVEVTNFSGILLSATFFVLVYEYVVAIIIAENSILSFIHAVNGLPFQIHAAHIGIITVSAMRVMDEHLVLQVDELRRQYLYVCTSKASKLRTWAKPASKGASGATANVCFFLVFCEVNLKTEVHGCDARPCLQLHLLGTVLFARPIATHVAHAHTPESQGHGR